jgi:Zn-dependent protease
MDSWGGWVLAAIAVVAAAVLAQWIRVFLFVRGARLSPAPAGVDEDMLERPLAACELAAIAELEGWGFVRVRDAVDRMGWEPTRTVFLANAELPHFALLYLRGNVTCGLPLIFVSFAADGAPMATSNRLGWLSRARYDSLGDVDARVDSVEAQWAVHRERAAQAGPVDASAAVDRIEAIIAHDREESLRSGRWVQGRHFIQFSFASAWKATRALIRDRRLLARPFDSAATRGEAAASFLTLTLQFQERAHPLQATERSLRLGLLIGTLLVSWAVWGAVFDWRFGAALIAVVLVHEGGHALAMRAFGWTNLHVFFLPMLGALATGRRPRTPAAWKDVVMLMAGPLPGLLFGLAVLASPLSQSPQWRLVALSAVALNAFNLLPLAPLDGGQIMAIALFNRWPRVRLAFTLLSAAGFAVAGWKLGSPVAFVFAVLVVRGWRLELQVADIERALPPGVAEDELVGRVCEATCARLPALAMLRRGQVAQITLGRRKVPRASVPLGIAVVCGMSALWILATPPVLKAFTPESRSHPHEDRRTPAQISFDRHWFDSDSRADTKALALLEADAVRLPTQDLRRRDLEWLRSQALAPADRASAVSRWLASGSGHLVFAERALHDELAARVGAASALPATERVAAMRAANAWVAAQPHGPETEIAARLRVAEALDLAGDEAGAAKLLDESIGFAVAHDNCKCRPAPAIAARAWFELAHKRPLAALRVLDGPVARALEQTEADDVALVRAWTSLESGDEAAGLAMLRTTFHADTLDANLRQRPGHEDDDGADDFQPWNAPELAFALHVAQRDDDARKLCNGFAYEDCAMAAAKSSPDMSPDGPWQANHARARTAFVRGITVVRAPAVTCAASR